MQAYSHFLLKICLALNGQAAPFLFPRATSQAAMLAASSPLCYNHLTTTILEVYKYERTALHHPSHGRFP